MPRGSKKHQGGSNGYLTPKRTNPWDYQLFQGRWRRARTHLFVHEKQPNAASGFKPDESSERNPPFMLQREPGTTLYAGRDIASSSKHTGGGWDDCPHDDRRAHPFPQHARDKTFRAIHGTPPAPRPPAPSPQPPTPAAPVTAGRATNRRAAVSNKARSIRHSIGGLREQLKSHNGAVSPGIRGHRAAGPCPSIPSPLHV